MEKASNAPSDPAMRPPPHDLTLYTNAYKQRASKSEAFRSSLGACDDNLFLIAFYSVVRNHFAAAKSLLYLPARSANPDFDPRDRRRHLWTHKELDGFGDVVETRTQELLEAQEQLLRSWYRASTQMAKVVRGFLARQRYRRVLEEITNAANQLERAKHRVWLLKKQVAAALLFQRAYRRHVAYLQCVETCRARLQKAARLFLFRLHRLRATTKIQRAFRCHRHRKSVLSHLHKLYKMLHASKQKQQLDQLVIVFSQTREQQRRHQQELLWERFPEKMGQLQRVQQRKETIAGVVLPLLLAGNQWKSKPSNLAKARAYVKQPRVSARRSLSQVSSLPALPKV